MKLSKVHKGSILLRKNYTKNILNIVIVLALQKMLNGGLNTT